MRINNNLMAQNAYRQQNLNVTNVARNTEKLSSGFRVNRSADDAAGLAISEKMRSQILGLNMASRNVQDAISLVQIAEGGLQTDHNLLHRMRELAIQAASDTNQRTDRQTLNTEVQQLVQEIDQISETTEFNGMPVLDGSLANDPLVIQAGANEGQTVEIAIGAVNAESLGVSNVDVQERESASNSLGSIDNAINDLSMERARLGAMQNRLEFRRDNLNIQAENAAAAESRIRDADMAQMMTAATRDNILARASMSMLAQANAVPQRVLSLLG